MPDLINAIFGGMPLSPYTLSWDSFIASLDLPALMAIPPTLYLPVAMRRQGKPV